MTPIFITLTNAINKRPYRINMNLVDSYWETLLGPIAGDEKADGSTLCFFGTEETTIGVVESPKEIESLVRAAIIQAGFNWDNGLMETIVRASRGEV